MHDPAAQLALPADLFRIATDVAGLCKEIATKTSLKIGDRNFVRVEGWMAIATAHGCCASARDVEKIDGGVRAIAEIRRMRDGVVLCTAEGFVGEDEPTWFGGVKMIYPRSGRPFEKKVEKRADYAIRAMAQTRAVSRACRTAFAHVVVMMNANLETMPAEEVEEDPIETTATPVAEAGAQGGGGPGGAGVKAPPEGGGGPAKPIEVPRDDNITEEERAVFREGRWRKRVVHFGKNKGVELGKLEEGAIRWYAEEWQPKPYLDRGISPDDRALRAALDVYCDEEDVRHKPRVGSGR